jgi:hypothetical protein
VKNGNAIGISTHNTRIESRREALHSRLGSFAINGGNMKTAEELLQGSASSGNGTELSAYSEDRRHDEESRPRMDSEGCPNGSSEDNGFRAAQRRTAKLSDGTSSLNSRLDVIAEKQPEEV